MNNLTILKDMDILGAFFVLVAVVVAGQFLYKIFIEDIIVKHGWESKKMRQRREDHEMIITNSQAIKELAEVQKRDNDISNEHDDKIKEDLSQFMTEVRSDIGELKTSMQESFDNSVKYRQVSIEKEQTLNNRIDDLVELSKQRDVAVEAISNGLDKLTKMFVDGQINDMRHRILNFAASVSSGKKYNMEAYQYTLQIYEDYERILKEHNMTNGLVEESIGFIRSSYQERLKNGDFGNYQL